MKSALLSTAAAALLLTAAGVSAQTEKNVGAERPPTPQQAAPAEKVAPPMNAGERKAPDVTGQAPTRLEPSKGAEVKVESDLNAAPQKGAKTGAAADAKPSDGAKQGITAKESTKPSEPSDSKAAASSDTKSSTTGQGAAAGAAKLTTEQRTQIATVIKQQKVEPVKLDISVRIGARVPSHVHFYPLPVQVIEIYPQWRAYRYILVDDEIVIIDPNTYMIVAVIEV